MHVHRVNSTCQHTILFPDSKAKVGAFLPSSKVHEADFYLRKTGDENSMPPASPRAPELTSASTHCQLMMMEWAWETCAIKPEERGRVTQQMAAISHTPPIDGTEHDRGGREVWRAGDGERRERWQCPWKLKATTHKHNAITKPQDHSSEWSLKLIQKELKKEIK